MLRPRFHETIAHVESDTLKNTHQDLTGSEALGAGHTLQPFVALID